MFFWLTSICMTDSRFIYITTGPGISWSCLQCPKFHSYSENHSILTMYCVIRKIYIIEKVETKESLLFVHIFTVIWQILTLLFKYQTCIYSMMLKFFLLLFKGTYIQRSLYPQRICRLIHRKASRNLTVASSFTQARLVEQ